MKKITVILLTLLIFSFSCTHKKQEVKTDAAVVNKKVLVLAIDGGGIKGILPAYFLTQVESKINNTQCYQLFDVIGGTSTGGIISIGLTSPYNSNHTPRTATEVLNFYLNDCGKIFHKNHQPTGPKYYAHQYGLEPFLQSELGLKTTLSYAASRLLSKKVKQVFTTSLLLNSTGGVISNPHMGVDYGPYLFNWYDALKNGYDDYYLWEAARATSAAPTYFPVAHLGGGKGKNSVAKEKWAVDGGVMSNDPAMWAITEALRTGIAKRIDDIVLISVGCGIDKYNGGLEIINDAVNNQPYGQKYGFWGDVDWGTYLKNLNGVSTANSIITETALNANQFVPATQLHNLAAYTGLEYHRIQIDLPSNLTAMDDCSNTNSLLNFAKNYFASGRGQVELNNVVTAIKNNL